MGIKRMSKVLLSKRWQQECRYGRFSTWQMQKDKMLIAMIGVQNSTNDILSCGNYYLLYHFTCAIQNSWGSYGTNCSADNVFDFSDPSKLALVNASVSSSSTVSGSSISTGTHSTATSSGTGDAQPVTKSNSSNSGVSGGTIGAAVVAGVMGLLFLITLGMLLAERRKRNQPGPLSELGGTGIQHPGQYQDKKMMPDHNRTSELPGRQSPVHEM
jgi:hypothetical protein